MSEHTLLDEHFVPIVDYPGYEVSNYGRVVNTRTGKDKKIQHDRHGNAYVHLHRNGERSDVLLRRLVAQGFFAEYKPWKDVYLINDHKDDCSVLNITLHTPRKDIVDRIRINELNETYPTLSDVARRIGGSPSVVSKCLMGMGKTHKGYTFSYVK